MKKSLHSREQKALSKALRHVRKRAGLSQLELSQKLEKPQSFVSKYESGERRLDFLEIRTICLATKTSLPEFIGIFENFLESRE